MLRYKTKTRPGLVALYDIRPGNGAGPFLQPRSPHGAGIGQTDRQTELAKQYRALHALHAERDKNYLPFSFKMMVLFA